MTLLLTQDFEGEFQFTSPSQLQGMLALQPERIIDGGSIGKLIVEDSTFTCSDACKIIKSSKRCMGNRCIGLMPERKVKQGQTNDLTVGYSLEANMHVLEIAFSLYTGRTESNGPTIHVDFSLDNGSSWERLKDFGEDDIQTKTWNKLQVRLNVPDNFVVGQPVLFKIGSDSRNSQVRIDNVEILGML
jgi:hypothetical protein